MILTLFKLTQESLADPIYTLSLSLFLSQMHTVLNPPPTNLHLPKKVSSSDLFCLPLFRKKFSKRCSRRLHWGQAH